MVKRRGPPSQGWKTFLRNHADGIAAMDMFVVPTISFRLLYGLLIMEHGRRRPLQTTQKRCSHRSTTMSLVGREQQSNLMPASISFCRMPPPCSRVTEPEVSLDLQVPHTPLVHD